MTVQSLPETSSSKSPDPVEGHGPSADVVREDGEFNEFSYRPVPVLAVVGCVLGVMSAVSLFIWQLLPMPLLALVLSLIAWFSIRRSHGTYGGVRLAQLGIVFGTLFFAGGLAFQVYAYQTEVPEGYQRLSFLQDISAKGFVEKDGYRTLHPDIQALDGKKVFIKGYIYQTGRMDTLKNFLLVKDNRDCCFGANPQLQDRIGVLMQGKPVQYRQGRIAVGGTFRLNRDIGQADSMTPLYVIEADYFTTHVTDF